ncbi:MAG: tRNA (guanosine(18)-2'-O)-methyltransferase TrmH [Parahaliea sp.]
MTPERSARLQAVLARRQPDLTLITDFVNKQRNLSAIVRNCDAAGVMQVHAVLGEEDYRTYRGTAMGSHRWVDVLHYRCASEAIAALRRQNHQVYAAHLSDDACDYRDIDYCQPTALLFGAERRGVSETALAAVDGCITVPMVGMVESFNVSVASGIILAEAQRQRTLAGLYARCRIDQATRQRLLFEWAYPQLRIYCEQRGLAYPPIDDAGELIDPSGWYASVQIQTAEIATNKDML